MRKCCSCGAEDRPQLIESNDCTCKHHTPDPKTDILGHSLDCQKIEHYVGRQVAFLKNNEQLTRAQVERGWRLFTDGHGQASLLNGKRAIQRFICIPCINKFAEADEIARYARKVALEKEQGEKLTVYQILCD